MRCATGGAHPCLTAGLRAQLDSLLYLPSGSAPPSAARVCRVHADRNGSVQAHGTILGVLRPLALTLALLTMFGCAGGWEGSTHVAPSIALQPAGQTVALGLTSTFTVMV